VDYAKEKILSLGSGEDRGRGRGGNVTPHTEARTRPRTWVQERLGGDGRGYGERQVTQVRGQERMEGERPVAQVRGQDELGHVTQVCGQEKLDGDGRDYVTPQTEWRVLERGEGGVEGMVEGDARKRIDEQDHLTGLIKLSLKSGRGFKMADIATALHKLAKLSAATPPGKLNPNLSAATPPGKLNPKP
jgi:hypothetical protein